MARLPSDSNRITGNLRHTAKLMIAQTLSICLILVSITHLGCSHSDIESRQTLRIATTTSTRDSGLMDELIPDFENESGIQVKLIAVGTGKALELGRRGEVDAILVHAEQDELEFLEAGHAVRREPVMYNYFEILGPEEDPAGIQKCDPLTAFRRIHDSGSIFVSRGDQSGTHKRELQLWRAVGIQPSSPNYFETGQGMGASLMVADQKKGYVLCDRGTYLAMKTKIELRPLAVRNPIMKNQYGVLCINPAKNARINLSAANQFADFLVSPQTQSRIAQFVRSGEPLFLTKKTEEVE